MENAAAPSLPSGIHDERRDLEASSALQLEMDRARELEREIAGCEEQLEAVASLVKAKMQRLKSEVQYAWCGLLRARVPIRVCTKVCKYACVAPEALHAAAFVTVL